MDFFVPSASGPQQAEAVFTSIAKHIQAPTQQQRVYKLEWRHEGKVCQCEIGKPLPAIFRNDETVLAIYDCGEVYKICTPNRGAIKFDPILASKSAVQHVEFFSH
ncbi:hypothetical protein [Photobacterium ganghwense]|uniref:hypothetical protein n=1 Tax=Photobacterium ganghwense TaxID=320778 RepID=UPI001C2DAC71|nr:hypothetical protein [Photobacterium ganghwense]MBV1839899.1 hypothetical protein [Photobacterium ganghwense]